MDMWNIFIVVKFLVGHWFFFFFFLLVGNWPFWAHDFWLWTSFGNVGFGCGNFFWHGFFVLVWNFWTHGLRFENFSLTCECFFFFFCGMGNFWDMWVFFFGMWFFMEWWAKLLCCKASRVKIVSNCWRTCGKHCLLT